MRRYVSLRCRVALNGRYGVVVGDYCRGAPPVRREDETTCYADSIVAAEDRRTAFMKSSTKVDSLQESIKTPARR